MTPTPPPAARRLSMTKHHGLGNDFLVVLEEDVVALDGAVLAKQLCDRRRGIGADGLIVAVPAAAAEPSPARAEGGGPYDRLDAVMALFNADGSRAEMSGNGVRCLAQALAMRRGTDSADLVVGTDAGRRTLQVRPNATDRSTVDVRVGMGPVVAGPQWQPSTAARAALAELTGERAGARAVTADIGNPHLVIAVTDPWALDVGAVGPRLEADFPAGINVQFIAPTPGRPDHLDLTVWERGAGVTEACGTGAAAAATVARRWGLVGRTVTVHMPGGTVDVVVGDEETDLIGPATLIAHIEVDRG